jgi:hypothetical protein
MRSADFLQGRIGGQPGGFGLAGKKVMVRETGDSSLKRWESQSRAKNAMIVLAARRHTRRLIAGRILLLARGAGVADDLKWKSARLGRRCRAGRYSVYECVERQDIGQQQAEYCLPAR